MGRKGKSFAAVRSTTVRGTGGRRGLSGRTSSAVYYRGSLRWNGGGVLWDLTRPSVRRGCGRQQVDPRPVRTVYSFRTVPTFAAGTAF
jgi:hypothetical protein